jgi:hypothetical protein
MKMQQKRQKCYNGWTHFQSGINWMQCMLKTRGSGEPVSLT